MNPLVRRLLPAAIAIVTLVTTAHAVHGLASSCWVMRAADDGSLPECCQRTAHDQVERRCGCCRSAWMAEAPVAGTTDPVHETPGATSLALAEASHRTLRGEVSKHGFRPRVDRPPDRSPPTRTIVLLL